MEEKIRKEGIWMRMVKKACKVLIVIGVCTAIFFCWGFCRIPNGGELIATSVSPDEQYTINAYLHVNSLSSDAIRCEMVNNKNGRTKNIYWDYPKSIAKIRWTCDDTVDINGVILNVERDKYDFRWD